MDHISLRCTSYMNCLPILYAQTTKYRLWVYTSVCDQDCLSTYILIHHSTTDIIRPNKCASHFLFFPLQIGNILFFTLTRHKPSPKNSSNYQGSYISGQADLTLYRTLTLSSQIIKCAKAHKEHTI